MRLTPKSSRDEIRAIIETAEGPAVAAAVRAVPENGAANKALISLVAKWLGVAKSSVELTSGAKSRIKILAIAPSDPAELAARLEAWAEDKGG